MGIRRILGSHCGFGTAVAIPASILIMLGMNPIKAAVVCLVANTAPTAFGAVGLPVTTLAKVTGLGVTQLGYLIAIQLFVLMMLVPFVLVMMTEGKGLKSFKGKGVLVCTLVAGLTFAVPEIFITKYLGPELPSIVGSLVCLLFLVIIIRGYSKKDEAGSSSDEKEEKAQISTAEKSKLGYHSFWSFALLSSLHQCFLQYIMHWQVSKLVSTSTMVQMPNRLTLTGYHPQVL